MMPPYLPAANSGGFVIFTGKWTHWFCKALEIDH